ncbi:hypothetical protein [Microcella humidisoli]|uniref:Uncharacterized protein n=1 Tax=Microcella humidisoli TaxID=2963406 RepID=A0ABY5FTW5_9MICO|nr:hypothetical protein [Microcella humidisoli]UTT61733.1 hypothetical protein NNL39_08580 [Microcella humidisoli]
MARSAAPSSALLLVASTILLAACTVGGGSGAPQEPAAPEESEPQQPVDGLGDTDCVVGTWALDIVDYRLQAENYLLGLGVPITEFDLLGGQTLTITQDGGLGVETNLRTSGVIVAGDSAVPVSVTTVESASAEWGWDATSPSGGLLEVVDWRVIDSESVGDGLDVAPPRFEGQDAFLLVDCDAETMLLQGGGPLTALFQRV